MSDLSKYVIKEGEQFFLDMDGWDAQDAGFVIESGDIVRFTYEGVKHVAKTYALPHEETYFSLKLIS